MSRSLYKGPYVASSLVKLMKKLINKNKEKSGKVSDIVVKTYSRSSTILPSFVNMKFEVHNGKKFIKFIITENMVGHKLGEFSHTRTFNKHSSAKKILHTKKQK